MRSYQVHIAQEDKLVGINHRNDINEGLFVPPRDKANEAAVAPTRL